MTDVQRVSPDAILAPTHSSHRPVPPPVLALVLASPRVRNDAVARGRAVVAALEPCPAEALAATLLDCWVRRRLP